MLVGVVADEGAPACPRCGSRKLRKLVSRIARVRPHEDALESVAGDAEGKEDFDSPESARRWAKHMSNEFGDELGGDFEGEVDSALDESEGESEEDEES